MPRWRAKLRCRGGHDEHRLDRATGRPAGRGPGADCGGARCAPAAAWCRVLAHRAAVAVPRRRHREARHDTARVSVDHARTARPKLGATVRRLAASLAARSGTALVLEVRAAAPARVKHRRGCAVVPDLLGRGRGVRGDRGRARRGAGRDPRRRSAGVGSVAERESRRAATRATRSKRVRGTARDRADLSKSRRRRGVSAGDGRAEGAAGPGSP